MKKPLPPKLGKSQPSIKILMSEETTEVLTALAEVKKKIKGVVKNSDNPFFKSSYPDLNQHLDTVEPILEQNDLFLLQPTTADETGNYVTTMIFHPESGQYIGAALKVPNIKDAQKVLAAVTYFRRGGLNALLALKSLDDDGESVVGRGSKNKKFKGKKVKFKKRNLDDEF